MARRLQRNDRQKKDRGCFESEVEFAANMNTLCYSDKSGTLEGGLSEAFDGTPFSCKRPAKCHEVSSASLS